MDDLQKRFQKRRAEILENPEPVEDAQFITPRGATNFSKLKQYAREMQAARQSISDPEKSDT